MDYLKCLAALKKEYREKRKETYDGLPLVLRILLLIIFFPLRVGFFFSRLFYWLTWFFFRALSAPVDYLELWLKDQKENIGDIAHAALYLVCLPTIFFQRVLLALNSFSFFFQWFGMMVSAYILTLGTIKWRPVITDAIFDEE